MTSAKMFMPIKFNTTIQLTPFELNSGFDDAIMTKLKRTLENICSKHGYIKKDSIKIIKRSMGYFKEHHFNGNIAFNMSCIAEICNPSQDSIIVCNVKAKNALGLLAEGIYDNVAILEVIVPKVSCGIQSEINIDTINIGDEIKVQVCGKKFILYDTKISIVGKVIKDKDNNVVIQENDDIESDVENHEDFEIDDIAIDADIGTVDGEEEDDDDDNDSEITKKINIVDDDSVADDDDNIILDDEEEEDEDFDEFDDLSGDEIETDPVLFDEDD